ncbi:MAG TPA: quinolinate synthase [Dehalococcoidia bacterium]|jgi:quinolinate synthase|nr:quinolinate synthase NadA [SAR202 cluster bacterium]MDP6665511.1 quinolinate synthase NadA [SAR202 cluster bacterium]MDP6798305.1 quinolinate synthase NadA [SAR202 cluster bacterium]MQG58998.1 quinolinate synthase NadA [SAR202 cluster bacterium]HAL48697.1 quinolinate synthase [Dehalococcoidia bacterium]|tara:strand:+ start:4447 stop:5655 length:1209 start_codon:yes stop_codon:yes gene_type:complete
MVTKLKTPTIPITEIEQSAFCQTDEKLTAKPLAEEFDAGVRWQKLPMQYMRMTPDELDQRIAAVRAKLGERVVLLGHHYQRDEIIRFADFRGDSFKLSQFAASQQNAEHIVFCGVHFMAETASILSGAHQRVILPNLTAGCSMADMAHIDDVMDCWDDLSNLFGGGDELTPITYMNSTAAIKALCGRNGGIVCTSSNAPATFDWAYEQGNRVLFLPDQHLGRNTGLKMGIGLDEMVVWNPFKVLGGNTEEQLSRAKLILWQGHCSVHTRFTVDQIEQAREKHPDVNVVVHPECTMEAVAAADMNGSTEYIIKVIEEAPAGSKWAVGTEISLVNRIAAENPDKTVFCLDPVVCPCSTMYRIHPAYLSWVLDGLDEGVTVNEIAVPDDVAEDARVALNRMLAVV